MGTSVIPRMWILIETTDENFKKISSRLMKWDMKLMISRKCKKTTKYFR
jgi:hypothetical protein